MGWYDDAKLCQQAASDAAPQNQTKVQRVWHYLYVTVPCVTTMNAPSVPLRSPNPSAARGPAQTRVAGSAAHTAPQAPCCALLLPAERHLALLTQSLGGACSTNNRHLCDVSKCQMPMYTDYVPINGAAGSASSGGLSIINVGSKTDAALDGKLCHGKGALDAAHHSTAQTENEG